MNRWVGFASSLLLAAILYWLVVTNGNRPVGIWIGTVIFSLFAVNLAGKAGAIAWHRRQQWFRRSVRVLRQIRKSYQVPPLLSFLHALGFAACFAYVAAMYARYEAAATLFLCLVAFLLSVAGLIDLIVWGNRFFRCVWTDLLGKIFSISVGAALVATGVSASKSIVHNITHVDPKYFIEATALLSSILVPLAYCFFGIALLYLYSVMQLLRVVVFVFCSMLAQQFAGFVGPGTKAKMRLLWYRIAYGKRPFGNQVPRRRFLEMAHVSLIAKPMSTICLIFQVVLGFQGAIGQARVLRPYVERAIVKLEYRTDSSCIGLAPDTAVAYMDDGKISQVKRQDSGFSFTVGTCNVAN